MYWSQYMEKLVLGAFRGATVPAPQTVYAALFLSNPENTGTGTEIAYQGYTRKPVTFTPPTSSNGGMTIQNAADIKFDTSNMAVGNVTHVGLYDSAVAGNFLAYMTLDDFIQVSTGVAPLILAQDWTYTSIGNCSEAFKTKMLNLLRGVNLDGFTPHVGLYNGDPENGGAELSGGNYTRTAVSFGAPAVQQGGQVMIATDADVTSVRSSANWGTWAYTTLHDQSAGGMVVAYLEDTANPHLVMNRGRSILIEAGSLSVSLN